MKESGRYGKYDLFSFYCREKLLANMQNILGETTEYNERTVYDLDALLEGNNNETEKDLPENFEESWKKILQMYTYSVHTIM